MRLFQIVVILIAVVFAIVWVRNFRSAKIRMFELLVGLFFAVLISLLAIFPDAISNNFAKLLGIKSNINAVMFGGIILSLWLNFRLWMLIRFQDRRITELNSKVAIQGFEKDTSQE